MARPINAIKRPGDEGYVAPDTEWAKSQTLDDLIKGQYALTAAQRKQLTPEQRYQYGKYSRGSATLGSDFGSAPTIESIGGASGNAEIDAKRLKEAQDQFYSTHDPFNTSGSDYMGSLTPEQRAAYDTANAKQREAYIANDENWGGKNPLFHNSTDQGVDRYSNGLYDPNIVWGANPNGVNLKNVGKMTAAMIALGLGGTYLTGGFSGAGSAAAEGAGGALGGGAGTGASTGLGTIPDMYAGLGGGLTESGVADAFAGLGGMSFGNAAAAASTLGGSVSDFFTWDNAKKAYDWTSKGLKVLQAFTGGGGGAGKGGAGGQDWAKLFGLAAQQPHSSSPDPEFAKANMIKNEMRQGPSALWAGLPQTMTPPRSFSQPESVSPPAEDWSTEPVAEASYDPEEMNDGGHVLPVMVPGPEDRHYARHPRLANRGLHIKGPGDGQSDEVPTMLSPDEYVLDADTVSALGNGSSDAGAKALDKMREEIRRHKRSAPAHKIPPAAKSPLEYLSKSKE
jgi:hypothetical protein